MVTCLAALALLLAAPASDVTREMTLEGGIKLAINAPIGAKPSLLIVYAAPNGSSALETLGRRPRSPAEWRWDTQHVLAQVRMYRRLMQVESVAVAVLEAPGKSWPAWTRKAGETPALRLPATLTREGKGGGARHDAGETPALRERGASEARTLIEEVRRRISPEARVVLMAHSGGGSLILAFLESGEVPSWVVRIALLDAVYSFDHTRHAEPLLTWLSGDARRMFVSLAYDDRFVELDGKPIVPPDGGTQRATARLRSALDARRPLTKTLVGDCDRWRDAAGQVDIRVDRNYANIVLHSALVGDMNGVLHALTFPASDLPMKVRFGGPRDYTAFIDPAEPGPVLRLPARPLHAPDGSETAANLAAMPPDQRTNALTEAMLSGNVPDFLRQLRRVQYEARDAAGAMHTVAIWVTPDVLSVGHDDDFLRVPLPPAAAQRIADAAECLLPTPRISDEIWRAAECRLQPRPLTSAREAWTTFIRHHAIIQEQRRTVPNGPIIAGIKKDVVICKDLPQHPGKVTIYGWHRLDGKPIQPVSLVHSAQYMDYSHGVRLVRRMAEVDGQQVDITAILSDANLAYLFSDEGPLDAVRYTQEQTAP
jgi:hypothetical protein